MCSSGIPLSFLQFEFFSRRIHFLRPTIPSFVQWWFKFEINNSPSVTLAAPPRPHALSIWWSIKCARLEQNVKTELNFGTIWEIDERDCSKGIICKKLFQNWLKTRKCIEKFPKDLIGSVIARRPAVSAAGEKKIWFPKQYFCISSDGTEIFVFSRYIPSIDILDANKSEMSRDPNKKAINCLGLKTEDQSWARHSEVECASQFLWKFYGNRHRLGNPFGGILLFLYWHRLRE